MSELEERINGVLNDPAQMERIMDMAKSLMGGEDAPAPPSNGGLAAMLQGLAGGGEPDAGMLSRLGGLLQDSGHDRDRRALLEAMKPWLSPGRRERLERAMRLAKLARIAGVALGETGGEGHV